MQRLQIQLLGGLGRHKLHRRALHALRQNSGALPYTGQANGCSLHEELPADRADFRKIKGSRCACGGQAALTSINIGFRGGAFCFAEGATSIWETRCKRSRCTSRETPCCGGTKGKE
jgi:hypothetical protein